MNVAVGPAEPARHSPLPCRGEPAVVPHEWHRPCLHQFRSSLFIAGLLDSASCAAHGLRQRRPWPRSGLPFLSNASAKPLMSKAVLRARFVPFATIPLPYNRSPGDRRRWAARARSVAVLAAYRCSIVRLFHPARRMRSASVPPSMSHE